MIYTENDEPTQQIQQYLLLTSPAIITIEALLRNNYCTYGKSCTYYYTSLYFQFFFTEEVQVYFKPSIVTIKCKKKV
jgi:hypothetical protein